VTLRGEKGELMKKLTYLLVTLSLLLAACGAPAQSSSDFDIADWDSVLAAAKGQTVNWYMWGGSDSINA
jgi:ABC-type uncharacterized transport system YnjBCD substrate-binding protein